MTPRSRTAVSLTPVSLDADSRCFRTACAFAETGFHSIVVEVLPSARRYWDERIEVRSPAALREGAEPEPARNGGSLRRLVRMLRSGALGAPGEFALHLGFLGFDWWRYRHRLRAVVPDAELYYLHSFELHRLIAGRAARLGAAIVYDAHDFYRGIEPPAAQSSFDRNRLRPFLDQLEERLVAEADAVITVSDGVANLMERCFNRAPAVIRNCHDPRFDRPVWPDLRTAFRIPPTDCLAVVAGNAKKGMAVGVAADAFALLGEHYHLAFIGRGYEPVAIGLRGHPAKGRIHFAGGRPPNEIVPLLATADIGLVLYEPRSENYRSALPNGFFQAISAGLPVVRRALPQIEAAIGGRDIGVVLSCLNAATLADAIRECARRAPALRPAVAALAKELSWEAESLRLINLVESVLIRPVARRTRAAAELLIS